MWYIMKKISLMEVAERIEDTRRINSVIYPLNGYVLKLPILPIRRTYNKFLLII